MREIKFRAWDSVQHKMLKPNYFEFIDGNAYWVESGDDDPVDSPVVLVRFGLVLEQYTGIWDDCGDLIFEGDIIEVDSDDGDYYRAPVKWCGDNGYPAFDLDSKYIPDGWSYDANALSTLAASDDFFQILGNIHENPDLLEVPHD